jgi:acetyl esterase/lipase
MGEPAAKRPCTDPDAASGGSLQYVPAHRVYLPPPDQLIGVVVWLHGGCFVDGDSTWDKGIAASFVARGMGMVAVDYRVGPAHPWPMGRDDAIAVVEIARSRYPHVPVFVGGSSSGAFFAYAVSCCLNIRCALLAPVLAPTVRARVARDGSLRQKQLSYFGSQERMAEVERDVLAGDRFDHVVAVASHLDFQAPIQHLPEKLQMAGGLCDVNGTHGVLCLDSDGKYVSLLIAGLFA